MRGETVTFLCKSLIYIPRKIWYTKVNTENEVYTMSFSLSSYTASFHISSTDTDAAYELRPSALFVYLQRAITDHSQQIGTSRDDVLSKYNCYWMVLRIWVKLKRPIIWGETLTVNVTVRHPQGTRIYRDCDLLVGQEQVGEATTVWVLANRKTKRPINLEHLPEFPETDAPTAKKIHLSRIVFPEHMELHDCRKLYYSDTDINGHINNTRYVDLASDAAELNLRPQGVFMQEILISYVNECFAGEEISLYRGKTQGQLYIHGVGPENTDRFDCTIRMSSPEGL